MRQEGEFAKASAAVLIDPGRAVRRAALGALARQPLVFGQADTDALIDGTMSPAQALARALPDREAPARAPHVAALTRALEQALAGRAP